MATRSDFRYIEAKEITPNLNVNYSESVCERVPLNNINVVVLNCRSIRNKQPEFENILRALDADVVIGTESWLTEDIASEEIFPSDYSVFRTDRRVRSGGGVFIAVSKRYDSHEIPIANNDIESVWCSIGGKKSKKLHICAFYRPPNADVETIYSLDKQIDTLVSSNRFFVIGGDFNLPSIDWKNNCFVSGGRERESCEALIHTFAKHSFCQLVNGPTRLNNTLDLLASNNPERISNVKLEEGISDHSAVHAKITLQIEKNVKSDRKVYLYAKADFPRFRSHLREECKWYLERTRREGTETSWRLFKEIINEGISKYIPNKMKRENREPRWFNKEVRSALRRQRKCHARASKLSENDTNEYRSEILNNKREARSTARKCMRTALNKFKNKILSGLLKDDPKSFWSYVREVKGGGPSITSLRADDGRVIYDSVEKANLLNSQFQKAFTPDNGDLGVCNHPSTVIQMEEIDLSIRGIAAQLKTIKPNKAPGPEGIPARVLKELADEIAPYLKIIFEKSMLEGITPRDWKLANVTPIHKGGDRNNPENYRPISLTSLSCKVLEHIIVSSIMRFLDRYSLLRHEQHGFRKAKSCETQLGLFIDDVMRSGEKNNELHAIFIDFRKAFDKVPHRKLVHKLKEIGINPIVVNWIKGFLSNRQQNVVIDGQSSDCLEVLSGVPQGSVLGPLLFLIYVNDICTVVKNNIRLFADDTVLYREITNADDEKSLQSDLDAISSWCKKWQLEINQKKSSVLCFWKPKDRAHDPAYLIDEISIPSVETVKYLGVNISRDLSWDNHIRRVVGLANKRLGFVRRIVNDSTEKVREICYFSLVRPLVEYASAIWDPYEKGHIDEIEKLQRRAARFVKQAYGIECSVSSLLKELDWKSLEERRTRARFHLLEKFRSEELSTEIAGRIELPYYVGRQDHSDKIREIDCRTQRYYGSFFPRTIREHNRYNETPR